jgi:hypothetical protein
MNIYNTPKDWEFGIGISFPSKSERVFLGSRMFHSLRFYIFIGPYTFAWGDEPVEVVEVKE